MPRGCAPGSISAGFQGTHGPRRAWNTPPRQAAALSGAGGRSQGCRGRPGGAGISGCRDARRRRGVRAGWAYQIGQSALRDVREADGPAAEGLHATVPRSNARERLMSHDDHPSQSLHGLPARTQFGGAVRRRRFPWRPRLAQSEHPRHRRDVAGCGLTLLVLSLPLLPEATPAARDLVWGGAAGLAGGVGVTLLYRVLALSAMATAIPKACLASSAIRCRDVETGPNLGVLAVFPSNGAICRCPLPSTGSRGLNFPASAVL